MSKWLSLVAVAAIAVVGCNKSQEGGNPGTSDSFTITAPTIPEGIKQGNKETVKLSISRGKDFKKDVKLSVKTPENSKIKATLNKEKITASEATDFNITLDVDKEAPLGSHEVTVTGTPEGGGAATSVPFTVKVNAP